MAELLKLFLSFVQKDCAYSSDDQIGKRRLLSQFCMAKRPASSTIVHIASVSAILFNV